MILKKFSLNPGTGGVGQFCGGDGVVRELEFRKPLTFAILSERRVYAPYGLHGDLMKVVIIFKISFGGCRWGRRKKGRKHCI